MLIRRPRSGRAAAARGVDLPSLLPAEERKFIRRYGARLDELACMRSLPSNDDEQHFLWVCMGQTEPRSRTDRL